LIRRAKTTRRSIFREMIVKILRKTSGVDRENEPRSVIQDERFHFHPLKFMKIFLDGLPLLLLHNNPHSSILDPLKPTELRVRETIINGTAVENSGYNQGLHKHMSMSRSERSTNPGNGVQVSKSSRADFGDVFIECKVPVNMNAKVTHYVREVDCGGAELNARNSTLRELLVAT
jgi:hypothetical protein